MNDKASSFQNAVNDLKKQKITLYHVMSPIDEQTISKIKEDGYFNSSKNALGGQSDGYYFFTTKTGANYHIKTMRDTWDNSPNKNAYILECEINSDDIKYPDWKLDYEATQDFLFDMIYDVAYKKPIKFNGMEISTSENQKLNIINNGKFSRIKSFSANEHSGIIEKLSDFLYKHDIEFKQKYDTLLKDIFLGIGDNCELFAVKTQKQQKITRITKIEQEPPAPSATNSQISKFLSKYGKNRH